MPAFLTGQLWKVGTIGAAIIAIIVGGFLIKSSLENRALTKERDKLSLSITDPNTGYIARLTQARANEITLQEAIRVQNSAYASQSKAAAEQLARLKVELAAAQARSRVAEQRLAAFMAKKPQGDTLEQRVQDIDNRVLQDLKR